MTKITLKAPAKINLWLDVESKRPDGYHNIESIMQTVTLFDVLTLERLPEPSDPNCRNIAISCTTSELACDESNLCYRAAQEFFSRLGITGYSVAIHIEKHIPIAAGLAGGSTDAAAALIGLNRLYNAGMSVGDLCELGRNIGADVPFCIKRGISSVRGIGERFRDCTRLPGCLILIACAGEHVSTPWAYKRLDELFDYTQRVATIGHFTERLEDGNIRRIAEGLYNIFEAAVLPIREGAQKLKLTMLNGGALGAIMSGSGPSVFGIYDNIRDAEATYRRLREDGVTAFICEPYYEGI